MESRSLMSGNDSIVKEKLIDEYKSSIGNHAHAIKYAENQINYHIAEIERLKLRIEATKNALRSWGVEI